MRFPWVSRHKLDEMARAVREAEDRALAAESRVDFLQHQLSRSENERTDINLKLIRVGFGVNPFHELIVQNSVLPETPEPTPTDTIAQLSPDASADEVRATFVRMGIELHGRDLRKVSRFVEKKQEEYYAHRHRPAVISPEEQSQADRVRADLAAAIAEGEAAAQE